MVGRGEAYPPVGREGCCRCECSSIAEGSRIECGEPWGRSHPSGREWERTKVAEPHGTGIPCRDQADKTLSRIGLRHDRFGIGRIAGPVFRMNSLDTELDT